VVNNLPPIRGDASNIVTSYPASCKSFAAVIHAIPAQTTMTDLELVLGILLCCILFVSSNTIYHIHPNRIKSIINRSFFITQSGLINIE